MHETASIGMFGLVCLVSRVADTTAMGPHHPPCPADQQRQQHNEEGELRIKQCL